MSEEFQLSGNTSTVVSRWIGTRDHVHEFTDGLRRWLVEQIWKHTNSFAEEFVGAPELVTNTQNA